MALEDLNQDEATDEINGLMTLVVGVFVLTAIIFVGSLVANLWLIFSDHWWAVAARDWFGQWWPLLILYLLPSTLLSWAGGAFSALRNKFDYVHPDDLDLHTGEWVEERLNELGIRGGVSVGGVQELLFRGVDAFDPRRDIIFLADKTLRKRDPMFWSIGAHELGHALVHRKSWIWSRANLLARRVYRTLYTFVPLWLLANSVLGWGPFTTALKLAIWVGIGAGVLVVIDEWAASYLSLKFMRSDPRVSDEAVSDIRVLLGSALVTYLSPLLAFGTFVALWPWLEAKFAQVGFEPVPPPVGTSRTLALVFAAVGLVLVSLRGVSWVRARLDEAEPVPLEERGVREIILSVVRPVVLGLATAGCVTGVLILLWDADFGDPFRIATILAAPQVMSPLTVVILPVFLLLRLPQSLITKLIGEPPDDFDSEEATDGDRADSDNVPRQPLVDPEASPWLRGISVGGVAFVVPLLVAALYLLW